MTANKCLWLSLILALSGASAALAQHGSPHDVEKLDSNGDGTITTGEFEAGALDRFTKSDTNKDGKVSADEMKAQFGGGKHEEAVHEPESFAKIDANSDGKVERSEVAKMPDPMFKKLDADKNGSLSAAEFEKGHADPHGKGIAGEHPEHGAALHSLPGDTNNDGVVTKAEAQADAAKMAKRLDTNGDGKISKEELAALHPAGAHEGPAHNPGKPNKPEAAHGGMHQPAKK